MRIVMYELKKLLSNKALYFIMSVCILICAFSSVMNIRNTELSAKNLRTIAEEISDLPYANAKEYIDIQISDVISEKSDMSFSTLFSAKEQLELMHDYSKFLDSVKERCTNITCISIFSDTSSFAYKNAEKTYNAYDNIKTRELHYDISQGIENIILNRTADILIIFILFASAVMVFTKDKETGMINLLRSYPKGRNALCISKTGVLFIMAVIVNISFIILLTILSIIIYGLGDLSRPIQTVNGFYECSYNISVFQYILISLGSKIIGSFIWALLFSLICTLSSNSIQIYSLSAVISFAEYFMYTKISRISSLGILHEINLIAFVKPENIYSSYLNLNIFGIPVNAFPVMITAAVIILCILITALLFSFSSVRNQEYRKLSGIPKKLRSIKVHGALFYELKKSMFMYGGIMVMVLFSIITILFHCTFSRSASLTDMYYERYTTENSGIVTRQTYRTIEENDKYFSKLEEKIKNSELSYSEMNDYQAELQRKNAFEIFRTRVDKIRYINGTEIFYDTGYIRAFDNFSKETLIMAILILLSEALLISPLISEDNGKGLTAIIYSTATGKKAFIKRNILLTAFYALLVSLVVMTPFFINILLNYGTQGLGITIHSIENFSDFPFSLKIWQYMTGLLFFRTLIFSICGLAMLWVSYINKSRFSALLINVTAFVVPVFVGLLL